MLLQKLKEYAARSPAADLPPMYLSTPIKWLIHLDREGKFLGLVSTSSGKKKNDRGKEFPAPNMVRTSGVKAKLLADRADYVLGFIEEDAKPKEKERAKECHRAFVALVKECAEATRVAEVEAVASFLDRLDLATLPLPSDISSGDNMTFVVNEVMPINFRQVQEFWAGRQVSAEELTQCLVCGRLRPPMKRQPVKIKGIPNGQPSGMALVSANAPAFESYGLEASLVAPICQECAEGYGLAINQLIRGEDTHLTIGPCVYLFWTREGQDFSPVSILASPQPGDVKALLRSVYGSRGTVPLNPVDFYAIALSSSGGRVAVRDWLVTTVGEVQQNLAHYFRLQRLADRDGQPVGLFPLTASLVPASKDINVRIPEAFINLALKGTPLPRWILYEAVRRSAAEQRVTRPRACVIKMALLSQDKAAREDGYMEKLDPTNLTPGYLSGRLLAVLEFIQQAAVPGIKATIVDRYYGTASSAPAAVYGRLLRTTQSHLGKLRKEKPGAYKLLQRLLEEVLSGLKVFPSTLSLQDQGLFALGYYHQRAAGWSAGAAVTDKDQSEAEE
ncbi:MAG TPA: type I-C CRISPR-associated protein Cas8c/Csd1 [Firmicutes bacterium]|nr:type I-C CRISPR-associated protein Cas8c/Csd1 [Bacillota bacterium]